MGGCDYCVIDYPTSWSEESSDDDDDYGPAWAACLSQQSRVFNVSQTRASTCHVPERSGAAGLGRRPGWMVWGLVVVGGFGCVSGSLV